MSPRGPARASNTKKVAFSKTLKNLQFFRFLGSRGLPREPQEAQEGSKRAPKRLQSPLKKSSKNGPHFLHFFDIFGDHFGAYFGA
jgi:hypothetical protein